MGWSLGPTVATDADGPAAGPLTVLPTDPAAEDADRVAAIARLRPTVLAVYGEDVAAGGGSGVLIDGSGLALTNHHVIEGSETGGWAGRADGRIYRWRLVGTDPGGDVALIRLTAAGAFPPTDDAPEAAASDGPPPLFRPGRPGGSAFPHAPLGDSDAVRVGQTALVMGNPFTLADDQTPTVTAGIISGVHRFQTGQGGALLVYGECLQTDAAINPGNSGGPLFDRAGRLLGINGRGSFQDRGRVNVGFGYAVGANQAVRFLPDLVATKICRHGALDAVFGDRAGGVICEGLQLDSPAAAAGLSLGDRLVRFEGQPIASANQFASLITTYPEGWPVELVVERGGIPRTIATRLLPLPYPVPPARVEDDKKRPGESPEDGSPEDDSPGGETPPGDAPKDDGPGGPDTPREEAEDGALDLSTAGEPLDADANGVHARALLAAAAARLLIEATGPDDPAAGDASPFAPPRYPLPLVRLREAGADGTAAGLTVETTIAPDGRFAVVATPPGGPPRVTLFDGTAFRTGDALAAGLPTAPADETLGLLRDPAVARAAWLAALYALATASVAESTPDGAEAASPTGPAWLGGLTIKVDGSDAVAGRPAYRLRVSDAHRDWHYLWLTVTDEGGRLSPGLLACGPDRDGSARRPNVRLDDWAAVGPLRLPRRTETTVGPTARATGGLRLVSAEVCPLPVDAAGAAVFMAPAGATDWQAATPAEAVAAVPPTPLQPGLALTPEGLTPREHNRHRAAVYAQARTVKIYGAGVGKIIGYGTGTVVSATGDIVTVSGGYLAANNLRVMLPDGTLHAATVVRRSESPPLAHLKIDAATPAAFPLTGPPPAVAPGEAAPAAGPSTPPGGPAVAVGEPIVAVSHAFKVAEGAEPVSCYAGTVSGVGTQRTRHGRVISAWTGPWLFLDAIVSNPGGGGGAVVAVDGRLVGITAPELVAQATGTRLNAAIPVEAVAAWFRGGDAPPAVAEAGPAPAAPARPGVTGVRLFLLSGRTGPAFVDRVDPGSAAATAGLRPDDLIVSLANVRVRDVGHYQSLERDLVAGRAVEVVVRRQGRLVTVTLTPTAAPGAQP